MSFDEFKARLVPYFAEELIDDVKRQLPQGTDYRIWGWDVGDFSGDGFMDVALSIRQSSEKKRIANVYLFTDIDGFLTNVGRFTYPFVELPLEVGVVVRDNCCYVMQKYEQFHWSMTGYRFDNGSLLVLDSFRTERIKELTHESYRNYQTLDGYETYEKTRTGEQEFRTEFLTVPSYPRSRQIYKGYAQDAISNLVRFVPRGAYWWEGEKDASLRVRSAYDRDYLYFSIAITDDHVLPVEKEGETSEKIEIWIDANTTENRFLRQASKRMDYRTTADSGLYSFTIVPGNFSTVAASVKISSTDELNDLQRDQVALVSAIAAPTDSGYTIKIRIPFRLLGFEGAPIEESGITELGCTVAVHDIDNYFRPEEESIIATSHFDSMNPASYGTLLLIPGHQTYGESHNIYTDPLAERLRDIGF